MNSLKGTRTEKNIMTAFAVESQTRNRYAFFASKAQNEGFVQIADVFLETAEQEKEHAKCLFKFLEGGEVEITASFPADIIDTTEANLIASAAGEKYEHTIMYPFYAKIASEEGFNELAAVMRGIVAAEVYHEKRFLAFAKNIKEGHMFAREQTVSWRCRYCGHVHVGLGAPEACPVCSRSKTYFEVLCMNW